MLTMTARDTPSGADLLSFDAFLSKGWKAFVSIKGATQLVVKVSINSLALRALRPKK